MGLDQYAYATTTIPDKPVDFDQPENKEQISYWRKHPNLQGWMHHLYLERGGKDLSFNVSTLALTWEDLDNLEFYVENDLLPETTGFFFGNSQPEHKTDDLLFIKVARENLKEGKCVFYFSWW
jgi:hypothetical protein